MGRSQRAGGSRGRLDLATAAVGALVVAVAAYMAIEDYALELESAAALAAFGETRALDVTHRARYAPFLLAAAVWTTVACALRAASTRRDPFLRRHAARPLAILLLGSALLDLAYYADTTVGLRASHGVRAVLVDPAYALGGVLIAGGAWRLRSLVRPLAPVAG